MASSNIARLGVVLALDTALFTAAVQEAINTNVKLKSSIQRESRAAEKEIQNLKYAIEDYGKEVSKVTQIERELETGRFKSLKGTDAAQRLLDQARAYDQIAKSSKDVTKGLSDQQRLALTYQTTDLVTQIASGQNALIALMQQGGQLKDQMGGIGPMFTAIRMALTPMVLGMTAAATAMGVLGVAFYQGHQEAAALRDQLILTGNFANLTQQRFLDLADTVSAKTNLSIGKTKDILMELVKSGKFTDQSMGSVAQAIANVAKLSGETASEVAQKLIPAFDGGADSIKSLNDRMHFLTLEQYKHIVLLDKQGKSQEAAKIAADALNKKLQDQERQVGTLEKGWTALKNAASAAWNALLNVGRPNTLEEDLERINKFIVDAANQLNKANPDSVYYAKLLQGFQNFVTQRQALLAKMESNEQAAKKTQRDTQSINDEKQFGDKKRQLAFETDQLIIKNRFSKEREAAYESLRIYIDAEEKIALARKEIEKKNTDEGGKFKQENQRLLDQRLISIEQEKQDKLRQMQKSAAKANLDALLDLQKEIDDAQGQELARRDAINKSIVDQLTQEEKSLEYEMQKLQLKGSLIGASDHALQIAMLELETQRKIAEIMANRDLNPDQQSLLVSQAKRNQGMQEMFISMQESLKATQRVYDAVFGNMERALENFVRTGKLSFKDLARSIIQDLILIQLKASATSLFRMFMGSLGFGSSSGALPSVTGQFGVGPTGFANGGNPPVGRASIVGERGPELFVPRTAGTIIPNNALSSLGGTQVVNNYNISAIDVKSFEDRIMGSSTAVWAANAYANKSLAIGRGRA